LFLILLGGVGILTFIKWEARVEVPVMDISLFRNNRAFVFSNLAALISYSATYAVTFLLSLYLQYIRKLTPENAGLVLVFQPIVQALFSPFSGKLSDRIEPGILASIGMALTALGLFLLAFLDDGTPLGFIVGSLILFGFGFSLFSSPNSNAVMRSVENRFYGVASGILGTMRMAGMAFSMGITILIFSIYIGKVQITPEYYPLFLGCIKLAFIFFGVLCVVGVLASLARGKIRRE
jgi:MFS family permease